MVTAEVMELIRNVGPAGVKLGSDLLLTLHQFFAQEANELNIVLAYLFGSQVAGRGGPLSDYDFALLFISELSAPQRYALLHRLTQRVGTSHVDLVVLNRAPIELAYCVITTGVPLYEESQISRVEFEAGTLSRYFDYLPILRRQREELLSEEDYEPRIQRYRASLRAAQRVLAQVRAA